VNRYSATVSVFNGTMPIAVLPVGNDPYIATYDGGNDGIYVTDYGSASVSVINGTTLAVGSVHVGSDPVAASYDSGNGYLYVTNSGSSNVSVLNGTEVLGSVAVGYYPEFATYDSGDGSVYVPNIDSNSVSAIFTGATVEFNESGLPAGTGWWVNVTGGPSTYSNTTNVSFGAPDGTSSYSIAAADRTYGAPGGSLTVRDSPVSKTIVFSRVTYPVTFTEVGLPNGTDWAVALGGTTIPSTAATVRFLELNGTYWFNVSTAPGWATSTFTGSLVVDGSAVSERIVWTQVTYAVIFEESGLPKGTGWWVNVSGGPDTFSFGYTLTFDVPNGTHPYSVSSVDETYAHPVGTFQVDGAVVYEEVPFSRVTYTVTFAESGLAPGTNWSVGLYATQQSSATTFDAFTEPNGTYLFLLGRVPGYAMSPSSGIVIVDGANQLVMLEYTAIPPATYTVSFTETGLPWGTIWVVTFNGLTDSEAGNLLFYAIANGTYSFAVDPVAGYDAIPSHGEMAVNGSPMPQLITFLPSSPPSPSTFLGLPTIDGLGVLGAVVIAIAAGGVLAILLRRGRRGPPSRPGDSGRRPRRGRSSGPT
jgi:YVTN family beta-propeller protein